MGQSIAAFDIDGTLMRSPVLVETLQAMVGSGLFPAEAWTSIEDSYFDWQRRSGSFDDFILGAVDQYVTHMTGVNQQDHDRVVAQVLEEGWEHTHSYTRRLARVLKASHFLVAISQAPQHIIGPLAQRHGFDMAVGSYYEVRNGHYTGVASYGWEKSKGQKVIDIAAERELSLRDSFGVGDTETDADFLAEVEHPIAFNPNYQLHKIANAQGWPIIIERKDMIYSLTVREDGQRHVATTTT
ncbi:HAD family phosphatase [Candidatus Microgenomates bacterium]|nr:HAD family phosphatase [Candidatus Microgenomates bacterium]